MTAPVLLVRWPRPIVTWTGLCCLSTRSALASGASQSRPRAAVSASQAAQRMRLLPVTGVQGCPFQTFSLEEAVPNDHLVRKIAAVLDLSWVQIGRAHDCTPDTVTSRMPPSACSMLIIGYLFAIRSERALCRDVQVNLGYRWFFGLSIVD